MGPGKSSKNCCSAAGSFASKAAVLRASTSLAACCRRSRVPAGEHDVGALGAGQAGGLQPDSGAAADQHDGLSQQCRFASCGAGSSCGAHDTLAICASIGLIGRGMSAITMRSSFTAAS